MSPAKFSITVMQIDTWNRDAMNQTGPTAFTAGPMPSNSYAKPHDPYSGLLECPMTSRVTKELDAEYFVQLRDSCSDEVTSEAECAAVVAQLALPGFNTSATTVKNASLPGGCSFAVRCEFFGRNPHSRMPLVPTPARLKLWQACDQWHSSRVSTLLTVHTVNCVQTLKVNTGARQLKASFNTGTPTPTPFLCGRGLTALVGAEKSLVELRLSLDMANPNATFELTGPAGVWFGVGFNAKAMGDAPWTVIVDGAGGVTERKLGNHEPGTQLPRSISVLSNTVAAGNRTVVLTRSLQGAHFNFSFKQTSLPFIAAVGSGPELAIHTAAAEATLTLLATDAPNCVCAKDPPAFGQGGGYGARFSTEIYPRGCHWFPCLLA
jgi:hypothetical protein